MPAELMESNPLVVEENRNQVAVKRGPGLLRRIKRYAANDRVDIALATNAVFKPVLTQRK